jgi:hypothetical protein
MKIEDLEYNPLFRFFHLHCYLHIYRVLNSLNPSNYVLIKRIILEKFPLIYLFQEQNIFRRKIQRIF